MEAWFRSDPRQTLVSADSVQDGSLIIDRALAEEDSSDPIADCLIPFPSLMNQSNIQYPLPSPQIHSHLPWLFREMPYNTIRVTRSSHLIADRDSYPFPYTCKVND